MDAYLTKWMTEVKAKNTAAVQPVSAIDTPLTPLLERLKKLIESLTPAQRLHGLPLEFYRERVQGRQAGRKAHAGELGAALRKLGYIRRRAWVSKDGVFRALWHPPVDTL